METDASKGATVTEVPKTEPETAVSVSSVSKSYFLWNRPQDRLKHALLARFGKSYGREFWALRDVSFRVHSGEAVGIVGRNGSGKSTLLQIVTGTVTPSAGSVDVRGRVASLLELGSGFNPDFTGRENVFLNGSILGIPEAEVRSRFGEIVAFADIGDFVEQPVRVYSSGMMMRLAFAVQAILSKDVLIVDEALAVGDEAFQRKCMRVMEEFREAGGTVLLVSHALQTIVRLCSRALLLHHGELVADDDSKVVTDVYQKLMYSPPDRTSALLDVLRREGPGALLEQRVGAAVVARSGEADPEAREEQETQDWLDPDMPVTSAICYGNGSAEILDAALYTEDGRRVNVVVSGRRFVWRYRVRFHRDASNVNFGMMLKTVDGVEVAGLSSDRELLEFEEIRAGTVIEASFELRMSVVPATYFLNAGVGGISDGEFSYLARCVDVEMIRVVRADRRPRHGIVELEHRFAWRELRG